MRALLAILVIGFAAPAAADPPKKPQPGKAPAAPAAPGAKKKPAAPAPTPGVSLGSMAAAATAKDRAAANDARTPNGARRLDLTPARLFGVKTDRRGAEKSSGVSLGDDSHWGVQAAQV